MQLINQLLSQVEERRDEMIDLVKALIQFETPSPPARNTKDIQDFIANFLSELDFSIDQWDVYPNDPNVVGVLKGTDPNRFNSLIINGHVDVAELDKNEQWKTDPFQPTVKDGYLIGRGAADMKGGIGASLFAMKLIHDLGIKLPGDVIFLSVIGEEVGEAGTLECTKKGYVADFAVVVDTSDLCIQGQGGVITGWITVKSPTTHHDATRRNMIHAGGGFHGASAIEKMMKIISGLQELERHWAVMKSYPGFPTGASTINPAVIEGGRHPAFIADECRLWITVHFYPNETHAQVAEEVEDYILKLAEGDLWLRDNPPTFEWGGTSMIEDRGEIFPSLEIDAKDPAVKALARCHKAQMRTPPIIDYSPTVTDGGWLGDAGIKTVIYGPGNLQNAHAVNERVSIEQLVDFTKVLIRFIYEWCSTEKE